jgi:hypothetical protein
MHANIESNNSVGFSGRQSKIYHSRIVHAFSGETFTNNLGLSGSQICARETLVHGCFQSIDSRIGHVTTSIKARWLVQEFGSDQRRVGICNTI